MANKETGRNQQSQQSTDLNQDRKSPGMGQSQQGQAQQGQQGQDRQQSSDRQSQDRSQVASDDSARSDKSSGRIDKDL